MRVAKGTADARLGARRPKTPRAAELAVCHAGNVAGAVPIVVDRRPTAAGLQALNLHGVTPRPRRPRDRDLPRYRSASART